MDDDSRPAQLEVEWLDGPSTAADFDATGVRPGGDRSRSWVVLVAAVVAGVIAASWLSTGSDVGPSVADVTIASTTSTVAQTTSTPQNSPYEIVQVGAEIAFPVEVDGGWLAVRSASSLPRLKWSSDGLNWSDFEAELPRGQVLLLDSVDDGLVLVIADQTFPGDFPLQVWRSSDGVGWMFDREVAVTPADSGNPRVVAHGDRLVIVGRAAASDFGFPGLASVIAEFIDPVDASRVCRVEASLGGFRSYSLVDCDGADVEVMATGLGSADLECLQILSVLTTSSESVTVLDSTGEVHVALDPFQSVSSVVATDEGFVSLIDVGGFVPDTGPCSLLSSEAGSGVFEWTSDSGLLPAISIEAESLFESSLSMLDDGRVLLAASRGAGVFDPPFRDWSLLVPAPGPGGRMDVSRDGRVLTYDDGLNHLWVAPIGGDWIEFDYKVRGRVSPLLGTDDYAIVTGFSSQGAVELVRVPFDNG